MATPVLPTAGGRGTGGDTPGDGVLGGVAPVGEAVGEGVSVPVEVAVGDGVSVPVEVAAGDGVSVPVELAVGEVVPETVVVAVVVAVTVTVEAATSFVTDAWQVTSAPPPLPEPLH